MVSCREIVILIIVVGLITFGVSCSIGGRGYHQPAGFRYDPYFTRSGDSLVSISVALGIPTPVLASANGLTEDDSIEPGTSLMIPSEAELFPILRWNRMRREPLITDRILWPVLGGRVSSNFGQRGSSFHKGIDIRSPKRRPVYAAHDGIISFAGRGGTGYGNTITITGKELTSSYSHNDENLVNVGDTVQLGEIIATVGETGNATGPHVHFETRLRSGRLIDPVELFAG